MHVSIKKNTLIIKWHMVHFYCTSFFHQDICFFTTTTCPSGLSPGLPVSWRTAVSGAYMTWGGGAVGWRCGGWGWHCYPEPSPASDSGRGNSLLVSCTGLVSTKIVGPCNILLKKKIFNQEFIFLSWVKNEKKIFMKVFSFPFACKCLHLTFLLFLCFVLPMILLLVKW